MPSLNQLPRSTPEAQGLDSAAISLFVAAANENIHDLHSIMLVRHGHVVAEGWWSPFEQKRPHMLYSLSKSFTSTAIGLLVSEGKLSVRDRVLDFFPNEAPATVDEHLGAMTVHDLLSMSTGHATDSTASLHTAPDGNWARAFLAHPVEFKPGTHFVYNSGATYMLSAILQTVTGETLMEYLRPRLYAPLGFTQTTWESSPQGVNTGGWGMTATTEDIAKFGQLYLQRGQWHGEQLVPAAWVDEATRKHVENGDGTKPQSDWAQGYGYQFWRCRHNIYRGDGAFGQYCIVMPEQDAVLAITGAMGDMQPILDLAWDMLLPAMRPAALPEIPANQNLLGTTLLGLDIKPCPGDAARFSGGAVQARVSGKTFAIEANPLGIDRLTLQFSDTACTAVVGAGSVEHAVVCGQGQWVKGKTALLSPSKTLGPVAASGAWVGPDAYAVWLYFHETPYRFALTCAFSGPDVADVAIEITQNVAFGTPEWPALRGKQIG